VTGRILASNGDLLEGPTPKQFREACQDLAAALLKKMNKNVGDNQGRPPEDNKRGGGNPRLAGLDAEIQRMITNNKTNAIWHRNVKEGNYSLEVDMAGVSVRENREFGTPVYGVGGTISIMLTDMKSGGTSDADVELERITAMSDDRIRSAIKAQVQPKVTGIIRELLQGLE
jgi:hypothetical protein